MVKRKNLIGFPRSVAGCFPNDYPLATANWSKYARLSHPAGIKVHRFSGRARGWLLAPWWAIQQVQCMRVRVYACH